LILLRIKTFRIN